MREYIILFRGRTKSGRPMNWMTVGNGLTPFDGPLTFADPEVAQQYADTMKLEMGDNTDVRVAHLL